MTIRIELPRHPGLTDEQAAKAQAWVASLSMFVYAAAERIAHEPTAKDVTPDEQASFRALSVGLMDLLAAPRYVNEVARPSAPAAQAAEQIMSGASAPRPLYGPTETEEDDEFEAFLRQTYGHPDDENVPLDTLKERALQAASLLRVVNRVRGGFVAEGVLERAEHVRRYFHLLAKAGKLPSTNVDLADLWQHAEEVNAVVGELLARCRILNTSHEDLYTRHGMALDAIRQWATKKGHEHCHYYPDIFRDVAVALGTPVAEIPEGLPPESEFRAACMRFADELYPLPSRQEADRHLADVTIGKLPGGMPGADTHH